MYQCQHIPIDRIVFFQYLYLIAGQWRVRVLVPVYGWFTEGFGTPDLIDARALLDELSE